jgi:hypothetical protein
LGARAFYDSLSKQYEDSIVFYEGKAISIDVRKAAENALTDFRHQGYQAEMAKFVRELRDNIAWYNSVIIRKTYKKKNFFYNWYIIPPDPDMGLIDIIDS